MAHRVTDKLAVGSSESVYLCSHGHIHIQYRDLNIAMSKNDFVGFAETMSQALSEWNKIEEKTQKTLELPPGLSV